MKTLFKKESHYAWAMVLLVCIHVIYMTYFFPKEWADTPRALAFIDMMASIVPAIAYLKLHVAAYTNYWGMFYASFWATYPIYMVLGFFGSFYLSPYRYQKSIIETKWVFMWTGVAMFAMCFAVTYTWPLVNNIYVHQMSTFLPRLIAAWVVTIGGGGYVVARMVMLIYLKLKLNRQS